MNIFTEVDIIQDYSREKLTEAINEKIKEGWQPIGGPFIEPWAHKWCWGVAKYILPTYKIEDVYNEKDCLL